MLSLTLKAVAFPFEDHVGAPAGLHCSHDVSHACHSLRLCSSCSGLGRVFLFSFHLLNPESNAIKLGRPLGRVGVASVSLGSFSSAR